MFMYRKDDTTGNICEYGATDEAREKRKMNKYDKKMYVSIVCNMFLKIKNKIKLL